VPTPTLSTGFSARRSPTTLTLVSGLLVGLALPACTSPFARHPLDIDARVTPDRVSQVRSLNLKSYEASDAATPDATTPEESLERARERFARTERMELSVVQARAATLSNNLELGVSLISPTIAAQSVAQEEGKFEAAFTLDASWAETDQPTASTLSGSSTRAQSVTPGLTVPLRTGGTASITLPITRFETDNTFSTLNPSTNADLQFSLSHNLLRGAGRRATTHGLRIAGYNHQISQTQTKLAVIRQLAAADRAYWRLYAAQQALDVRVQQYTLAKDQYERAVRFTDAGETARIEVVRAQSGLADRVEQVIRAQNTVLLTERTLKRLINIPGLDVDSATAIDTISPPDPVRYEFDTAQLTVEALANRMEMLELELRLASDAAGEALARNQALPLVAMSYSYRVNGLGGTEGDAFSNLGDNDFEDWSVGLRSEIPLGNEERKAGVMRAVLTRLQRLASIEDRTQSITQEVYDAADTLATNWQRILAARESVILNTRLLLAEQNQFGQGANTSNDVLDADTALAQARLIEIDAIVEYQISQIDLAFATGTLLGSSQVEFDAADPTGDDPTGNDPAGAQSVPMYHPASGIFPVDDRGDDGAGPDGAAETDSTQEGVSPIQAGD
jgi:outer membrane protein